jgi:multiple sugar transport system permease protein
MNPPRAIHWAMVTPAQLLLVAFILVPALHVAVLSTTASTYGAAPRFVGLDNYAAVLADGVFWRAVVNTFVVVNVIVYGELLLGLGLAVLLSGPVPARALVFGALLAPYAITEASVVTMWRFMLEPDVGLVNWALESAGIGQIEWTTERFDALMVVALLAIWQHLPFTFLILHAALATIPAELAEAARVDGATPWQNFVRVTLPLLMPAILIALLFRYIFAVRLFAEVWLLTEGGPARLTEVLGVYLYRQAFRYHEFGMAAATGWIMLALSLLLALPYLLRLRRAEPGDA